jgi:hypothetical protein
MENRDRQLREIQAMSRFSQKIHNNAAQSIEECSINLNVFSDHFVKMGMLHQTSGRNVFKTICCDKAEDLRNFLLCQKRRM